MYHARIRTGNARNFAERIYRKIDLSIRILADRLIGMKGSVYVDRRNLAHPDIPLDKVLEFLTRLGSDEEGLEPCEVALFAFLKLTSNSVENIARASRGGSG